MAGRVTWQNAADHLPRHRRRPQPHDGAPGGWARHAQCSQFDMLASTRATPQFATHIRLDDDLAERFARLVEATGSQIVLSTFWRHFEEYIRYVLYRHGVPATTVIGRTPGVSEASSLSADAADASNYANRAAEIRAWLDEHPEVERFVVIDDRASASNASLAPHFVKVQRGHMHFTKLLNARR